MGRLARFAPKLGVPLKGDIGIIWASIGKRDIYIYGLGLRVWGLGFRVKGLGLRVWGLGFCDNINKSSQRECTWG